LKSAGLSPRSTGFLYVTVASVIWGSNGVIVNRVPLESYAIAFFRVFSAGLTLLLGILLTRKWTLLKVRHVWRSLVALGILLSLGWAFLFQAMKLINIGDAVLLNYTAPIFVALLAPILLEEKLKRATAYALAISMVGVLLIFSQQGLQSLNLPGVIWGLLAGFVYGVFTVLSKRTLTNLSSYSVALYSYLVSAVFLAPTLSKVSLSISPSSWLLLLFMGVFNTAFAVTLYFRGLRLIRAQEAAVLTYLEPVSTAGFGYLLLAQRPTLIMVAGGLLILSAGYVVSSRAG